jgi:S-DNA-T family DNA segregation ATPase FtsK/SpoIIIE
MFVRKARRGRIGAPPSLPQASGPEREPQPKHLDLIGLGCVVLGIYLVFVLYFGWDGGRLGSGLRDGLNYTIGLVAYVIPLALFATGGILIFRPALPSVKPLRAGAACLVAGLMIAFAAGTAGIAGGREASVGSFDPGWVPDHGGVVGESMYWLLATLLQPFGAHLVAIFALIAGILLLTGTTVAAVLSRSGKAIKHAGVTSTAARHASSSAR